MKKHYVYRITNNILNKHYYGTRGSLQPSKDIGIKYFSSSSNEEFINDQKLNPKNYRYKIIMIFDSRVDAVAMEIKLHNRFDVAKNESFYNKAKQTSTGFDTTGIPPVNKGVPLSNKVRAKLSKATAGVNNPNYGKTTPKNVRDKISHTLKNNDYKDSEKTKKLKSDSARTRKSHKPCISLYNETGEFICKSNGKIKQMVIDNNLASAVIMRFYRRFIKSKVSEPIFFEREIRAINNGNILYKGWYFKYTT